MTDQHRAVERQRQRAYERLGSNHPVCIFCGLDDWRCLEPHHLAGEAFDDLTGILCRNCHRTLTDPTQNQRAPEDPPVLERIGHLLIGLAQFLIALAERLGQAGQELLQGVAVCPPPYGWAAISESEG
jgi:hypothetical protein